MLSSPDFYCNFSLPYIAVSTEFFKSKKELISKNTEKNLRLEHYVTEKDVLKYSMSMEVCNCMKSIKQSFFYRNVKKIMSFTFTRT